MDRITRSLGNRRTFCRKHRKKKSIHALLGKSDRVGDDRSRIRRKSAKIMQRLQSSINCRVRKRKSPSRKDWHSCKISQEKTMKISLLIFDLDGTLYSFDNAQETTFTTSRFYTEIKKNAYAFFQQRYGIEESAARQ